MRQPLLTFLLALLILSSSHLLVAQSYQGVVRDGETGHSLPRVILRTDRGRYLAETNSTGHFAFDYEADSLSAVLFAEGYRQRIVQLRAGSRGEFTLLPFGSELEEVTVTSLRTSRGNSSFDYTPADAKKIVTVLGEADPLRYLQVLPGVSPGMEGGLSYFVRGAGNSNNRVELDGVPVMAPTHLFGFFSVFPSDVLAKSTFQMGGITASSGDFLSSLLRLETHQRQAQRYTGSISLSPIVLGGSLRGPIVKNKLSIQVAGRTSLLRQEFLLLKSILGRDKETGEEQIKDDFNPQVQDLYAKLYWAISPQHTLDVLIFGSHDYFDYKPKVDDSQGIFSRVTLSWDNRLAKLRWQYTPSALLRFETLAYYSDFRSDQGNVQLSNDPKAQRQFFGAKHLEQALQSQFVAELTGIQLSGGLSLRLREHHPLIRLAGVGSEGQSGDHEVIRSQLYSAFAEGSYQTSTYSLKGGLRYDAYRDGGKNLLHSLDVRLKGTLQLTPSIGLEASFDRLSQYQHTLEGLPIGWALDLVVPASRQFLPERAHQGYVGGFWGDDTYYATLGAYYKELSHVTAHRGGINQFTTRNVRWHEDLLQGRGRSFGLELWVEKRKGRLTGTLAYTLSRTTRHFAELNEGKTFPFANDRTHNLSMQAQYETIRRARSGQAFTLSFAFSSGTNMTLPVTVYRAEELPFWDTQSGGIHVPPKQNYHATTRTAMTSVNGYRLPYYLRLDAGYTFRWQRTRLRHELTISVYNVLNRHNAFLTFYDDDRWKELSIMPLIPSIRWETRF